LRSLHPGQQRRCVLDQHLTGVGEADVAAGPFQHRGPGLALQHRELLREGARRVPECAGGGVHGPAPVNLAQDPEAVQIEHSVSIGERYCALLRNRREQCFQSSMVRMGALYCLLSAVAFGAMAVFGKLAYDAGVSVDALLLVRFGLAGGPLLLVALARGTLRGLSRRAMVIGLAMGAFGYAAQGGLYFAALSRIYASLVALILYVYPVLVMVGAMALGREHASRRRVWALGFALAGIALVLTGATTGRWDWFGALLAFGAAVTYTIYILVGDHVTAELPPLGWAAPVCCGAFCTFLVLGAARSVHA